MVMLKKIGRLFQIKTRLEAWLVIYAIALGAVERGRVYLDTYPGAGGWLLAVACTGVVFVAGGKLLDSVKAAQPALAAAAYPTLRYADASPAAATVLAGSRSGAVRIPASPAAATDPRH
jgi:hypothetical protein